MENNLSSTCMTYAKFSSIKRTCFKEIDRRICCNFLSVNTWLRHPRSLLTREWSQHYLLCCFSFTPNEEQSSLAIFLPPPTSSYTQEWARQLSRRMGWWKRNISGCEEWSRGWCRHSNNYGSLIAFWVLFFLWHIRSEQRRIRMVVRERCHLAEQIYAQWSLLATGNWELAGCRPV